MKDIKNIDIYKKTEKLNKSEVPNLKISKIGIVARDYRELNGNSDFSKNIIEILKYLDDKGCDSVLFSLFTLLEKNSLKIEKLEELINIKSIFIEEFEIINLERDVKSYKIYSKQVKNWKIIDFTQKFGTLKYTEKFKRETIIPFIKEVEENRIMGNCVVLLCGETNIVKYSKKTKKIEDVFDFTAKIPSTTEIVLNPIHDKMTRFEMKLKRKFLSKNNRIVISVWNKGKTFSNGKTRDGINPPWTVYLNEREVIINKENIKLRNNNNLSKIEVGILNIEKELKTQNQVNK